jgi:cell division protein FtsQ
MKQLKSSKLNRKKKANIPLRRKIALFYNRMMMIIKIMLMLFIPFFLFTNYFNEVKQEIIQNIYELAAEYGFRLENVLIEGQYNTKEEDILNTLNADKGTPIFAINMNLIMNHLRRNPWIKNIAIIERRLPNTIYIRISERIPIAIWQINGQIFLIDEDGYKITNNIDNFSNLLHVVGSDANIYTSKLILDLANYPDFAKKVVSAVRYGERRWDLNLEQAIIVKMPEVNFKQALDYLVKLHKKNLLFNQNYKIIDLRDSNKLYIEKY